MPSKNCYGVDLGSNTIKLFCQAEDQYYTERNLIAVTEEDEVIAVGDDAYAMYEKVPPGIRVDSPVKGGRIADADEAAFVLRTLLRRTETKVGRNPSLFFSVPVNMSGIEKKSLSRILYGGYLGKVHAFAAERPILDALGLGIPLSKNKGVCIVNVGEQMSEISIVAGEQILICRSIPIGGAHLTESVQDVIRREGHLIVGEKTAQRLKCVLATFGEDFGEERKVFGISTISGLPKEGAIAQGLVSDAVKAPVAALAKEISSFLERIPPQISAPVEKEGIFLAGGTARLTGIDTFMRRTIGLSINVPSAAEMSTIRGLREMIALKSLQRFAVRVKKE